ncbi:MAG: polyprenyl synthetase family protein [Candidatus Hydrogenedentes bacterium]|nr:polyprenyl synthetase family protein [Candidatus Hydrogenedentota bacterium]
MTQAGANAFLSEKARKVERALELYLGTWNAAPDALREAVQYSLFAGGKRLRPALAFGACEMICGDDAPALPAACALEMIHTYSLIHDDLPAMDNDDLRRGRPTLHKMAGEAMAILAGDTLLTMAFHVVACDAGSNPAVVQVIAEIAEAAGAWGMAGGQVLDMAHEGHRVDLDALRRTHAAKTGALICVAVRAGALLAGAKGEAMESLTHYGEAIGLAFQIADDILDVTGSEAAIGKPVGSDAANEKATYPALVGLEQSRKLADEAVQQALHALSEFGPEAGPFRALAGFIVNRDR